jgi:hypothetical protein
MKSRHSREKMSMLKTLTLAYSLMWSKSRTSTNWPHWGRSLIMRIHFLWKLFTYSRVKKVPVASYVKTSNRLESRPYCLPNQVSFKIQGRNDPILIWVSLLINGSRFSTQVICLAVLFFRHFILFL